jgi:hypothetical protein
VIKITATLNTIQKEIKQMKKELCFLRHVVEEDYPLSKWASREFQKAGNEMANGNYVQHKDVLAKYG